MKKVLLLVLASLLLTSTAHAYWWKAGSVYFKIESGGISILGSGITIPTGQTYQINGSQITPANLAAGTCAVTWTIGTGGSIALSGTGTVIANRLDQIVAAGDVVVGSAADTPTVITKGANNSIFSVDNAGTEGFATKIALAGTSGTDYNLYDPDDTTKQFQFLLSGVVGLHKITLPDGDIVIPTGTLITNAQNTSGSAATLSGGLEDVAASTSANLATTLSDEVGTDKVVFNDSPTFVDDITIAAAGVKLTGSDGDLTILGLGDGADESITINLDDTDNVAVVTSTALKIDFSALNLATTGVISGRVFVATDADGKTLAGEDLNGSMQMATGAGTWTIPDVDAAAGTGQSFCLYSTAAAHIVIAGDAEDKIRLNGTLGAAGGDITNNTADLAGDFICLMLTDFAGEVAHWTTLGRSGTWTVVP